VEAQQRGDHVTMLLAEARARGINVEQAVAGYRAIDLFLQNVRRGERPRGGVFVGLLRLLLHHPEVLMWEKMWLDAHRSLYQEIAGAVKWSDPQHQVGYGLWQVINTYNPYLKAQYDQSDYQHTADFLKPVLYHTPAGARFKNFVDTWHKGVLADATPEGAYQALATVLELDEFIAPYAEAPLAGFKPAYITRWTQRLIADTQGRVKVYPGIGVGVGDGGASKTITPQEYYEGVHAAFDGGAHSVLLSRNYSEATLENLAACGRALRERGLIA
jgi:hypothetical protein